MSSAILRLKPGVMVQPWLDGENVDCRLLFAGDRYRQIVRAYAEAVRLMSGRRGLAAVKRRLAESNEIRQFYEIDERDGQIGITLRDEYFREQASLEDLSFELKVSGGGRERLFPLPLERFASVGRLLPLLAGDRTEDEVAAGLRSQLSGDALGWAQTLLSELSAHGFLERAASAAPNAFLDTTSRPRVTFLSHTSLLLQSRASSIVLDPLLPLWLGLRSRMFDVTRLALDAICCSHSHWDHCDVASLLMFDKRTPILIPKVRRRTIFNPPVVPMLKLIGFEDIREVELWQPLKIGDIEIVPVPFHGEQDEPGEEIDHYTYVLRTGDWTLYGGVDAFRDTYGDMLADLERVRRDYQPTLAFLPVSRMTYAYATGGVNGFCRRVDTGLLHRTFQYTAGPDLAVEWVRRLGVSLVVPYATFTFRRTTPAAPVREFADELAKVGLGDRLLALRPLDGIDQKDLEGGARTALRRRFLNGWLRSTSAMAQADQRLSRLLVYRGLRRVLTRPAASSETHHH